MQEEEQRPEASIKSRLRSGNAVNVAAITSPTSSPRKKTLILRKKGKEKEVKESDKSELEEVNENTLMDISKKMEDEGEQKRGKGRSKDTHC